MTSARVFGHPRPGVTYVDRPGAYALLSRDDHYLFVRTPHGLFLPGGGIDPGETQEQALARELVEEIDWTLERSRYLGTAEQYLYSKFYGKHHRKIGYFYEAWATPPARVAVVPDHEIAWVPKTLARAALTLDFQRIALDLV